MGPGASSRLGGTQSVSPPCPPPTLCSPAHPAWTALRWGAQGGCVPAHTAVFLAGLASARGAQGGGVQCPQGPRFRRTRGGGVDCADCAFPLLRACAVVKVGAVPPPPSIMSLRAEGRGGSRPGLLWRSPNFFAKVLFGSCFVFFCPKHCNSAGHLSTDDRPTGVMGIFRFTEGHSCLRSPSQTALIRGRRQGSVFEGRRSRAGTGVGGGEPMPEGPPLGSRRPQGGSRTSVGVRPSLSRVPTAAMGRGIQRSKTRPNLVPRK